MANLDNFRGDGEQSIPQNISTWTEDSSATAATATAAHAGETGKSHYITGFACSAQSASGQHPDEMVCTIKNVSSTVISFTFQSDVVDDYAPGGNGTIIHSFSSPIHITEGNETSIVVTGAGTGNLVNVNLWGFTNDTEVE